MSSKDRLLKVRQFHNFGAPITNGINAKKREIAAKRSQFTKRELAEAREKMRRDREKK